MTSPIPPRSVPALTSMPPIDSELDRLRQQNVQLTQQLQALSAQMTEQAAMSRQIMSSIASERRVHQPSDLEKFLKILGLVSTIFSFGNAIAGAAKLIPATQLGFELIENPIKVAVDPNWNDPVEMSRYIHEMVGSATNSVT